MITQREISKIAFREKMSDKVIEKDYCLTWLLFGIAESQLGKSLAFKGGTALKKIYFPNYRYSEDLDFTLLDNQDPSRLIPEFTEILGKLGKSQGFQFEIPEDKVERRDDSLTLYVNFVGPLQARLGSRDIKVDFTLSEKLLFPVKPKTVHSPYSDAAEGKLNSYSLEEILTEKLCAVIGRTEPRDIYDIYCLLGLEEIDLFSIPVAFREKAEFKGIDPSRIDDVLDRKKAIFERMWEKRLQHQIKELPHFEEVMRELKRSLKQLDFV